MTFFTERKYIVLKDIHKYVCLLYTESCVELSDSVKRKVLLLILRGNGFILATACGVELVVALMAIFVLLPNCVSDTNPRSEPTCKLCINHGAGEVDGYYGDGSEVVIVQSHDGQQSNPLSKNIMAMHGASVPPRYQSCVVRICVAT